VSQCYLASHIYFACDGEAVIFLDLHSDNYKMLAGAKAQEFKAMLSITTDFLLELSLPADQDLPAKGAFRRDLLSELQQNRLLTDKKEEAAGCRANIALPVEDLIDTQKARDLHIGLRDLWRFTSSCIAAAWRLRFASIHAIVGSLRRRKRFSTPHQQPDLAQVRLLLEFYRRLRPLFPHNFLCLFDSLALIEFLSRYHFYPDMIFAIKLDPWAAHCWVQYGTVALNQNIEEASCYVPIMAV
jgi:hypothetical protein